MRGQLLSYDGLRGEVDLRHHVDGALVSDLEQRTASVGDDGTGTSRRRERDIDEFHQVPVQTTAAPETLHETVDSRFTCTAPTFPSIVTRQVVTSENFRRVIPMKRPD